MEVRSEEAERMGKKGRFGIGILAWIEDNVVVSIGKGKDGVDTDDIFCSQSRFPLECAHTELSKCLLTQ